MPSAETAGKTIPLLVCVSLGEALDFYRILGFEVTFEQTDPYEYAAARRGGIELHFHGRKQMNPEKSFSTCLVFVPRVEPYHRAFADALRASYGKVPTAGLPRITRLQKGQTRFTTLDPSGNRLIYIARDEPDTDYGWYEAKRSRLVSAIENAAFLRDTYYEDAAAAKVLDKALARDEPADAAIDRARALAARAELAVAVGDTEAARAARAALQRIRLSDEDRERFRDELEAPEELERWLGQSKDQGTAATRSRHRGSV
jgi:hypothetical protein